MGHVRMSYRVLYLFVMSYVFEQVVFSIYKHRMGQRCRVNLVYNDQEGTHAYIVLAVLMICDLSGRVI